MKTLETPRLVLRPWRPEDADDLYLYASDPRVGSAADWPPHRSVDESRDVIRTVFARDGIYALELRATRRVVGCIGLLVGAASHFCLPDDEAEAGYWIGVPLWGKGLVTEALEALVRHAFDDMRLEALWCCSFLDNPASQRVQQKCGFRHLRSEPARPDRPDGWPRPVAISRLTREEAFLRRFTLRRAEEKDIPLLRALAGEAFPATYRTILQPAQLDYMMAWMYGEETLRRELAGSAEWYVAAWDGEPCGYLSLTHDRERVSTLQKIYVLPAFQGRGIGQALFRRAAAAIREAHKGPCRMELHVNRQNRAAEFYRRMGMRLLSEGDYPIGDGFYMNDYIMGLDIT